MEVKTTNFPVQKITEGQIIPEGFSERDNTPGRKHYYFKEGNKTYHFCIDYDGFVKEINLQEKI